jgi:predicted nucleic-acid-binding protein
VIGLDTNVLVRSLLVVEGAQSEQAAALVRRAAAEGERLYVSDVVLCEAIWVLGSVYGFGRPAVAVAVRELLETSELVFRDGVALERAVADFELGPGGLADYIIREAAVAAGCTAVATFDKALLRQPGFISP